MPMSVKSMYRKKPQLVVGLIGALVLVVALVATFVLAGAHLGKRGYTPTSPRPAVSVRAIRSGSPVSMSAKSVGRSWPVTTSWCR